MTQQCTQSLAGQGTKKKKPAPNEILYLLLNEGFKDLEICTFIEQVLCENAIKYKFSPKTFTNSILWLQAKPIHAEGGGAGDGFSIVTPQYSYENEFALLYYSKETFIEAYASGNLHTEMMMVKKYKQNRKQNGGEFKVIVVFHSVHDSLFNVDHGTPNKAQYDKFLIDLTLSYEFDYIQLDHTIDVIDFLKEMHASVQDKPYRKELSMYSRKGFRPGKKAILSGFKDPLSVTYISFLMCIPGVSENKAIGLAKIYPTIKSLMDMFLDEKVPEKEKLAQLREIEVCTSMGDKNKKLGKVLADRIFKVLMCVNPNLQIN
ncbi:hypothetical protein FGO68_gene4673 [Halteria grandinella]|uniref:ERCC4 domain-containing protein n=1 Tax=Halteria grandinella TaxID=5974 RepID=A0A8J8NLE1_HALGN|nr:hypothetical protein FGO68_gene4673 [Halteria grandinella]